MDVDDDDSKVSSRASDNSSLSLSTKRTMDSRISVMEHGLTQLTVLMNQVLTQTAKQSAPIPIPVTPSQKHTGEDKASNPSKDGSKPEEPPQGDSGVG
jgi:hypothetical protein